MKEMPLNHGNSIGLSEFIEQVKQDLLSSQPEGSVPMFAIVQVEVEMRVVANKVEKGRTGVDIKVLGSGLNAEVDSATGKENTQTVKVTLSPLVSKDQILGNMTAQERADLIERSEKSIARGEDRGVPVEERA